MADSDPGAMRLEGLHHITMITGDAQANVDFCTDVLGLRLVKKTVNFDAPDMYHLYYGNANGAPGSILTWFEMRGARQGRAGAGMIHTIELAVPARESFDFWERRLSDAGCAVERHEDHLAFSDHDGLGFAIVPERLGNPPLRAAHPAIPHEHAIIGIEGARAYPLTPDADDLLLGDIFGFRPYSPPGSDVQLAHRASEGGQEQLHVERVVPVNEFRVEGRERSFRWRYDVPPTAPAVPGAGTVHHIAWCCTPDEQPLWQERARAGGLHVTPVQDRDYFTSIYTRMPSGVLFEIATDGPGFAVDEDPERLGEELRIPSMHEQDRERIEQLLTPITLPAVRA